MQLNEASLMLLAAAELPCAAARPARTDQLLILAPDLSKVLIRFSGSTFQAYCGSVSPQVSSY